MPANPVTFADLTEVIHQQTRRFLRMLADGAMMENHDFRIPPVPWDINDGYCYDFARAVCDHFGGMRPDDPRPLAVDGGDHCVIKFRGRYYDAECPEGVEELDDLPWFRVHERTEAIDRAVAKLLEAR